jgi:hypothetical protein
MADEYFQGKFSKVEIAPRALTPEEIRCDYEAETAHFSELGQLIEEVRQGGHITLTETPNQTPSAGIIVWADWTNFEKRQFDGNSVLDALHKARRAMPSE